MIKTMSRNRKKIGELSTDIEVVNPIESKALLGGWGAYVWNNYHDYGGTWDDLLGGNYNDPGSWDLGSGSSSGSGVDANGVPNLPSTVEQQLGSMGACVSYAMSFMSGVLGHQITGANMALHNAQVLHVPVMTTISTGLNIGQSTQAIQSYFNTTTLTDINQVIRAVENDQKGVLANVYVYENGAIVQGLGHEVAIVDYDIANGIFYAADSNTGTYSTYTASQINMNAGVFEINSVK